MKDYQWKELNSEGIQHFRKMQHRLNTYYREIGFHQSKMLIYFKERLITEENIKILIKKIGSKVEQYEYLIYSEMTFAGFQKENENWIHIDGIQLERDRLSGMRIFDHPAFDIICMTDLYNTYSNPVKEDEVSNLNGLK